MAWLSSWFDTFEDDVVDKLKRRAKGHARSMEDEVRHILRNAVQEGPRKTRNPDFRGPLGVDQVLGHYDVGMRKFKITDRTNGSVTPLTINGE